MALQSPFLFLAMMTGLLFSVRNRRSSDPGWILSFGFSLPCIGAFALYGLRSWVKINWPAPAFLFLLLPAMALYIGHPQGGGYRFSLPSWLAAGIRATPYFLLFMTAVTFYHLTVGIPGVPAPARAVGWRELSASALQMQMSLSEIRGRSPFFLGMDKYSLASELAFYTQQPQRTFSQDVVGADGLRYAFWTTPSRLNGQDALAVIQARKRDKIRLLLKHFRKVGPPQPVEISWRGTTVGSFLLVPAMGYLPEASPGGFETHQRTGRAQTEEKVSKGQWGHVPRWMLVLGICWMALAGMGILIKGGFARKGSGPAEMPANLGNHPWILQRLERLSSDNPLTFAVVGDTKSFGTFESILRRLQAMDLDFIVNLGDFVHQPTPEDHQHFIHEMSKELKPQGPPMLLIPGNHDVDPSTFPISAFEDHYGPSHFVFQCAGNLFVGLNNAVPKRKGGFDNFHFLENVMKSRRESVRRVFVLAHKPLIYPGRKAHCGKANRWMELFHRYNVDYVVASHLHRYSRSRVGNTVLLISGGGGATLDREAPGAFHHAVILRIDGGTVQEDILAFTSRSIWTERLRYFARKKRIPFTPWSPKEKDGTQRKAFLWGS